MDVLKENLTELEVGSTVESLQKFIDFQKDLFHSQIDQLQKVVVTQCKLTGVNPLAQEMVRHPDIHFFFSLLKFDTKKINHS